MTKAGAKKWAKEIAALQDGKTIQCKINAEDTWDDALDPQFREDREYRVRVEPMEFLLGRCPRHGSGKFKVVENDAPKECPDCEIIHVKQVL